MTGRWFVAALAMAPLALGAQGGSISSQCPAGTTTQRAAQDACQKAIDLFTFMAPQFSGALIGGNAVAGEHSALGGPGRFSFGVRVAAIRGRLPDVESQVPSITGAVATNYTVEDQLIPVPAADVAVGVFPGVFIGGSRAFAIDGLVNVAYIPEVNETDVSVTLPDGSLKLGFGARVGIIQESVVTPGISVTWIQRDLPRLGLTATPGSDQLNITDFEAKTRAWRAIVGKNLGVLALTAGFGQDTYELSAAADVRVVRAGTTYTAGPIVLDQSLTRDNAFGSVALRLPVLSIVGEYGRVSGGKLATFNTYGNARADDALEYASVGIRLRF